MSLVGSFLFPQHQNPHGKAAKQKWEQSVPLVDGHVAFGNLSTIDFSSSPATVTTGEMPTGGYVLNVALATPAEGVWIRGEFYSFARGLGGLMVRDSQPNVMLFGRKGKAYDEDVLEPGQLAWLGDLLLVNTAERKHTSDARARFAALDEGIEVIAGENEMLLNLGDMLVQ